MWLEVPVDRAGVEAASRRSLIRRPGRGSASARSRVPGATTARATSCASRSGSTLAASLSGSTRPAVEDLELRQELADRVRGTGACRDVGRACPGGPRARLPAPRRYRVGGPRQGGEGPIARRRPDGRPSRPPLRRDVELRLDASPGSGPAPCHVYGLARPDVEGCGRPGNSRRLSGSPRSAATSTRGGGRRHRARLPRRCGVGAVRRFDTFAHPATVPTTGVLVLGMLQPATVWSFDGDRLGTTSATRSATRSDATRSTRWSSFGGRPPRRHLAARAGRALPSRTATGGGGRWAGSATAPR